MTTTTIENGSTTSARRKKMMKNLQLRGGVYYVRKQITPEYTLFKSLDTGELEAANARKKTEIANAIELMKNPAARVVAPQPVAKLGQIIMAYKAAAEMRCYQCSKPRPRSVRGYVAQLRKIVHTVTQMDNVDELESSVLTRDLLAGYVRIEMANIGKDANAQRRARTTVAGTIRNARAVFSSWALDEMRTLTLPDLTGFMKAQLVVAERKKYKLPAQALRDATREAARKLRDNNDPLYAVYLLTYHLGMRAGEAAAARWDWIGEERDRNGHVTRYMEIITRPYFRPKSRDHAVPIPDQVWAELIGYKWQPPEPSKTLSAVRIKEMADDHLWILPGDTNNARYRTLIIEKFSEWMQSLGWTKPTYYKGAHELRKLRGHIFYTRDGLEASASWLGDNPQVIYDYYADPGRRSVSCPYDEFD